MFTNKQKFHSFTQNLRLHSILPLLEHLSQSFDLLQYGYHVLIEINLSKEESDFLSSIINLVLESFTLPGLIKNILRCFLRVLNVFLQVPGLRNPAINVGGAGLTLFPYALLHFQWLLEEFYSKQKSSPP